MSSFGFLSGLGSPLSRQSITIGAADLPFAIDLAAGSLGRTGLELSAVLACFFLEQRRPSSGRSD